MDVSLSSSADLAASSWTLPQSHGDGLIPENATFQDALQSASQKDTPEKIAGVAKQFEALMVGQILKTARESSGGGGWLDTEDSNDDQTDSMVMELGEQGLAQAIALGGGLGIAKMVTANLQRAQAKTPSSDSEAPPAPASKNMGSKR